MTETGESIPNAGEKIPKDRLFYEKDKFEKNDLQKNIFLKKENDFVFCDQRLDTFIIDTLRRIPEDFPVSQRSEPVEQKGFISQGLFASVVRTQLQSGLTVNGQEIVFDGNKCTRIDFKPGGRVNFDDAKLTDSLANGIVGITEFLKAVDSGKFEAASVLIGTTNLNMALIAQRLGFSVVDQCRTSGGEIDKTLKQYIVVGELDKVRGKVEEYKKRGTLERVQARHQRDLQRALKPSLA